MAAQQQQLQLQQLQQAQQQQIQMQQQQYMYNQQQQYPQSYNPMQGQTGGAGAVPETAPFLKDFNLIAEAAKRAQLACLMRDMDDMEL